MTSTEHLLWVGIYLLWSLTLKQPYEVGAFTPERLSHLPKVTQPASDTVETESQICTFSPSSPAASPAESAKPAELLYNPLSHTLSSKPFRLSAPSTPPPKGSTQIW